MCEGPEVLLDGKSYKPVKYVREEHLAVESVEIIESFFLFGKELPVFLSFNKDRSVHFLLGFGHSLHVLFFHLLRFFLQNLVPTRLSFESKRLRVDDLVANEVSDVALDFVKLEFPDEGKDLDELFELEVDAVVFV
jgi:hypothetical protein